MTGQTSPASPIIVPRSPQWMTPAGTFGLAAALYLLLCALAFFVARPTTFLYFTDYWEHRAIIEAVMRGGTHLLDPIYGEAAPSRQFTPWSLALGYLARLARLDVDTAMAWGAMLVSALFVAGVWDFARVYHRHRWAPALLLAVLTCGWGVPPLIWTGFYALRSQIHGNYYPAELVFSLTFVAWAGVIRLVRHGRFSILNGVLVWFVVAGSLITHPLNAAFLIAGAIALVVFEPGIAVPRRIGVALVIGAGIAATSLWPYFNPLSLAGAGLARGQQTFNNFGFFFNPFFVIALVWPTLFALMALPGLIRDPSARMPVIAFVAILAAYVAGGIADVSVSHRFLAYVVLTLHILLVTALLRVIDGRPLRAMDGLSPQSWRVAAIGGAALAVVQIALTVQQFVVPFVWNGWIFPVHVVDTEMQRVRAALPPGARILGWDSAALVMPAYGFQVVAFPRPMPLSPSDVRRQADYRRFFTPGVSPCERRTIAHRWSTTHIAYLTHELHPYVQRELRALGTAISPVGPWRIIVAPPPC
jgi:hypothetical protein